jgi:hypothetical protein
MAVGVEHVNEPLAWAQPRRRVFPGKFSAIYVAVRCLSAQQPITVYYPAAPTAGRP